MAGQQEQDVQRQLDALVARMDLKDDDVAALQQRAEVAQQRLSDLERRMTTDRDLIRQLKEQGAIDAEMTRQLEQALVTSRMIGTAMGIIMARHLVSVDMAFQLLRKASQDRNIKLRTLAQEVVETGTTGGLPGS